MATWLFDLGNTRLKCAPLAADGGIGEVVALPHREGEVAAQLRQFLPARFDLACVASVAGSALTAQVLATLAAHCPRISVARTQATFAGLRIAYAQPRKLGVDRFLALLAARRRGGAALVCGVGTAITVDLLDADGRHLGGRIAPSPTLMREALHLRAPHLPVLGGEYHEFAADTEDALASGCDGAAIALIGHSLAAARQQLGAAPALYLHGGGGEVLLAQLPMASWAPTLVLEGLAIWARGAGATAVGADTIRPC